MSDTICIQCWSPFTAKTPGPQVTCPHCGAMQSSVAGVEGPADRAAPLFEEVNQTTQMEMSPELLALALKEANRSRARPTAPPLPEGAAQTMEMSLSEVVAAMKAVDIVNAEKGIKAPDLTKTAAAPVDRTRDWRLRSPSGLDLHFPSLRLVMEYGKGLTAAEIGLARRGEGYRSFAAFALGLTPGCDPESVFDALPYEDADESMGMGGPAMGDPTGPPSTPKLSPSDFVGNPFKNPPLSAPSGTEPDPFKKAAAATGHLEPTTAKPKPKKKRTPQTKFAFRTAESQGLLSGRWANMAVGVVIGGGVVWALAWVGLLPGIHY